jgi:hypothetical protein
MGGGVRNDRPIHDLRDLDVPPGEHRVRVSLTRREADASGDEDDDQDDEHDDAGEDDNYGISIDRAERERIERTRRQRAALPAAVVLDTALVIEAGRVVVITYDAGERRFAVANEER